MIVALGVILIIVGFALALSILFVGRHSQDE
jgi:hypothetical protein